MAYGETKQVILFASHTALQQSAPVLQLTPNCWQTIPVNWQLPLMHDALLQQSRDAPQRAPTIAQPAAQVSWPDALGKQKRLQHCSCIWQILEFVMHCPGWVGAMQRNTPALVNRQPWKPPPPPGGAPQQLLPVGVFVHTSPTAAQFDAGVQRPIPNVESNRHDWEQQSDPSEQISPAGRQPSRG